MRFTNTYFQNSFMDNIQRNSQQYLASTKKFIYCISCKATNIMNNLSYWTSNEGFKKREKLQKNQNYFLHELTWKCYSFKKKIIFLA